LKPKEEGASTAAESTGGDEATGKVELNRKTRSSTTTAAATATITAAAAGGGGAATAAVAGNEWTGAGKGTRAKKEKKVKKVGKGTKKEGGAPATATAAPPAAYTAHVRTTTDESQTQSLLAEITDLKASTAAVTKAAAGMASTVSVQRLVEATRLSGTVLSLCHGFHHQP
jgi:hypothetical protein